MVWYVPPLSPVQAATDDDGDDVFAAIEELRIPVDYLASLFTAGDTEPVLRALRRLAAMRAYMRARTVDGVDGEPDAEIEEMYCLLSLAKYKDRFVIPPGRGNEALALAGTGCNGCG
jgi:nitrate reductase beta subunit